MKKIESFIVRGHKTEMPADKFTHEDLIIEAEYQLQPIGRDFDQAPEHEIVLDAEKTAEFEFNDGTVWICDRSSLHDIFPEEQTIIKRASGKVELNDALNYLNNERSFAGDLFVKIVRVFTKKVVATAVGSGVKALAQKLEDNHLSANAAKKIQEGLFFMDADFQLHAPTDIDTTKPVLLFIHGTNSSAKDAYGGLGPADNRPASVVWTGIQKSYGKNVLAYQHRTLTESPLTNAVALARALPDNISLHIVSHSRGGLIGDILCRYSADLAGTQKGFSESNITYLEKEGGRKNDIDNIKALDKIFAAKNISVKKFIRVASPAAGTKLASKRLEHIFNVFFNLLGGKLNPYANAFRLLINEILKTEYDINVLPGVESMNPESPFIKILNDRTPEKQAYSETTSDNLSLAIIAGNIHAGLSLRGLAAIITKLFFWQRNDMVVNTDSMYLGVNRQSVQYYFANGDKVTHTTYFEQDETREALRWALEAADGLLITGYTKGNQAAIPANVRELERSLEHGTLMSLPPTGKKPILILLPGIMGSNLTSDKKSIWINYWNFLRGGLLDLADMDNISAKSVVRTSYEKFADYFSGEYDVVIFPFDWREQLNVCAGKFNELVLELMKLKQPIKIAGHSMGGVLVRDFIVCHPNTWQQLRATAGFRLLFLGAPLGGSVRIPAVLFGYDDIINKLSAIDLRHSKKELLTMFSSFPGILSLLPLTTDPAHDFADIKTWQAMRSVFGDGSWPLPSAAALAAFKIYRDRINAAAPFEESANIIYIAGKDKATPADYYNDTIPPRQELVFLYTEEGDQSVTWESGIPQALIDAGAVYYVNVTHGALANERDIFDGIADTLSTGKTQRLSRTRPAVRDAAKIFRITAPHDFDISEKGLEETLLGLPQKKTAVTSSIPVAVSVSAGDLHYAAYPVLAGHFKNDGILYAEAAIDKYMGNVLSAKNSMGIYPGEVGTNDIFFNDRAREDFKGAVIIGLGEQGLLTAYSLAQSTEQGVTNYLLTIEHTQGFKDNIGISSLIVGCGYGGLSVDEAAKAILEGVKNANTKLSILKKDIGTVKHVEFVELYEDRALSCMYALSRMQTDESNAVNVKLANTKMKILFGMKTRLPFEADSSWWNRLSVSSAMQDGSEQLLFSASTGNAREEERLLVNGTSLVNLFLEDMSVKNNWTPEAAKTVFEMMIPNDMKDRLKRRGNVSWILDEGSAQYPWELLQDKASGAKPLCVSAGMIRQLKTQNFDSAIRRSPANKALVIGDPILEGFAPQLPGARKEAETVASVIEKNNFEVHAVIGKNTVDVVKNYLADEYRIIHLAGHGIYQPGMKEKSGMIIGDGKFLTTAHISQMPAVPDLVFINCCHLGKISGVDERFYRERFKLAANLGSELIQMGVKAVIAAGWTVNDNSANEFANTFYSSMFAGKNFGNAVKDARQKAYQQHEENNTWGAYQCYGDPFFKLARSFSTQEVQKPTYLISQEAETDLGNLLSSLETTSVKKEEVAEKLNNIIEAVTAANLTTGPVMETIAKVFAEIGDNKRAVEFYDRLFLLENAVFSVAAMEKWFTLRVRTKTAEYQQDPSVKIRKQTAEVIKNFTTLLNFSPTAERYGLLGSAYKRLAAMLSDADRKEALQTAAAFYRTAFEKKGETNIYALTNWYNLEAIIKMNDNERWSAATDNTVPATYLKQTLSGESSAYHLPSLKDALAQISSMQKDMGDMNADMDYWALANTAALMLCGMVMEPKKAGDLPERLIEVYEKVWHKCGSFAKRKAEIDNLDALSRIIIPDNILKTMLQELYRRLDDSNNCRAI